MRRLWDLDQDLFRRVQSCRTGWLDPALQAITWTGVGWVQILLILAIFVDWRPGPLSAIHEAWQEISHAADERRTRLAIPLLGAYALSGTVNMVLKQAFDRDRPSNLPWVNALEDVKFHSFSSGHTATAFGIAGALWWLTRATPLSRWGQVGLAWACLVGFSRMYVGVHWPTDVLSGAVVGSVCGTWVAWLVGRRSANQGKP